MLSMNDLILKKRNGGVLSKEEIEHIVKGYTDGDIPDYQMSAFLMAVWFVGMNDEETTFLTTAMAESGDMLDLAEIREKSDGEKSRIIDKHSTGGVGDKTTLIIGPILAALGVPVAKMSGRGLGHTGGTIDKLESIPGFSSDLSEKAFIKQVKQVGFADMCQTKNLAPADKKIYALRDVTGTVDNYSLIASSVMSKKIAAGADGIVLDVKCGSGAFMKDIESARKLAKIMVQIGKNARRSVTAVISDMNEPLGCYVGNALEVFEAIQVLQGKGDERLKKLSFKLAAEMYMMAVMSDDEKAALDKVNEVIESGKAYQKWKEFVAAQGGDPGFSDEAEKLISVNMTKNVCSEKSGVIISCDTEKIGLASLKLGGGREKLTDEIDPSVGIVINKHLGDRIEKGEKIATLYVNNTDKLEEVEGLILDAYSISDDASDYKPEALIKDIIR